MPARGLPHLCGARVVSTDRGGSAACCAALHFSRARLCLAANVTNSRMAGMFAGTALATHQQTRPGLCPRAAAAPARALPPSPRRVSSQIAVINRSIKKLDGPKTPPSEFVVRALKACS